MKYADRSLFGKRTYELREATVFVSGTTTGGTRFEVSLDYAELNPNPEKLWLRSPLVWAGIALIGMAMAALFALGVFQSQDKEFLAAVGYCVAVIGIILIFSSLRKIEMIRFRTVSGVMSLDVIKAGEMKQQFEAFVLELQKRIRDKAVPNPSTNARSPNRSDSA